jgi:hypothetical protein
MARRGRRWRELGRKRSGGASRGTAAWRIVGAGLLAITLVAGWAWSGRRGGGAASPDRKRGGSGEARPVEEEIAERWEEAWRGRLGALVRVEREDAAVLRAETAGGTVLWFPEGEVEGSFRKLEGIWRHAGKEGRTLATVNLVPERNLPVTYR